MSKIEHMLEEYEHRFRKPYLFYTASCYDCGTDVIMVADQYDDQQETYCPRCKGTSLVGGRYYQFDYPLEDFYVKRNP